MHSACAVLCHFWPVLLYDAFPHYLIKYKIFEKKISDIKCVFGYSLPLLCEIFLILRRTERDRMKNVYFFM
jgi:hypothetical protein